VDRAVNNRIGYARDNGNALLVYVGRKVFPFRVHPQIHRASQIEKPVLCNWQRARHWINYRARPAVWQEGHWDWSRFHKKRGKFAQRSFLC
jgi:hypothetical protein